MHICITTWIGLNDIASEGNFETEDLLRYSNFDSVNPSALMEERIAFTSSTVVSWNDYYCGGLGGE